MGLTLTTKNKATTTATKTKKARRSASAVDITNLPEAGELLPVEAIDRTGLVITSEGALVRILHVTPPNPMILSPEGRQQVAGAYCQLVSRLKPGQNVQFYVQARPVDIGEVLTDCRKEVAAHAGPAPTRQRAARDPLARSRWQLYGAMETGLRAHAAENAAVKLDHYIVIPLLPESSLSLADFLPSRKTPSATLERDLSAHRRLIRQSYAQVDTLRAELEALSCPTRLLNGEEVVELLWSRFNPTSADSRYRPSAAVTEILGELDAPVDMDDAARAAMRLRERIARSSLDFKRSKHFAEIEHDLEQTIYAATTADATYMGWLMSAMMPAVPHTMSVHVRALDRSNERRGLKMRARRLHVVNRDAEAKGNVPDWDRVQQEQETHQLLHEMAGHERAGLFEVSVYQSLRVPGPDPDAARLQEAVDYCAEQISTASDCSVNKGEYQQEELWQSTLPLGRDVSRVARKYVARNVGDTVPLLGTHCGSPTGVPFAYSDPGRELQMLNPFDRAHSNGLMIVAGKSGTGKTMMTNVLLARLLAFGARGFVIDRAGHFKVLVDVIDGARQIDLGADDAEWAINPWDVPDVENVSPSKVAFLVSLHQVLMGDEGLTVLERSYLATAIRTVYARCAFTDQAPRESLLAEELRDRAEQQPDVAIASTLRHLADRLGEFYGDGSYAYLLDRPTTVPVDSPLIVFDTRRVPEVVLQPVIFATLEFISRTVEEHRDANSHANAQADAALMTGRSVVVLDEAWHLVSNPASGAYVNDLVRRGRHLGMALLASTQQASDFDSESGVALLRNATQIMLLGQSPDEVNFLREALHLTDAEAQLITRLKTVKGSHSQVFWINGTRGRGVVALRVSPMEYWAFTSDPIRDVPARAAKVAQHDGDVWAAIADLAGHDIHNVPLR